MVSPYRILTVRELPGTFRQSHIEVDNGSGDLLHSLFVRRLEGDTAFNGLAGKV
jgi:hypothetical protein